MNASRFALARVEENEGASLGAEQIVEPLDVDFVTRVRRVAAKASKELDRFEYSGALQVTEQAFWEFCDHYLELVKSRSYAQVDTPGRRSALATLQLALRTFLRLFAPFLPFVCEEIWSWRFAGPGRESSIHTAPWPTPEDSANVASGDGADRYACAIELSQKIRAAKTRARRSLRWPVESLDVSGQGDDVAALRTVLDDVLAAGNDRRGALQNPDGPGSRGRALLRRGSPGGGVSAAAR